MRKLNIHLVIKDKALRFCQEVNRGIQGITNSEIVFDQDSPMIPHLSLIRGELDGDASLEDVKELIPDAIATFSSLSLYLHSPYLESDRNSYVLSDVEGGKALKDLIHQLYDSLCPNLIHPQSQGNDNPHITLAYINANPEAVRQYLSEVKAEFEFESDAIEISDSGERGTCINSLAQFDLSSQ
ncbi:MAG: 2'-5' RNA ligase family protein [Chroococcales cyanobacterium]